MSDARLRELERRFRESGSADDEVAWLVARVRTGELSQRRLTLAAYCEREGARRACERLGLRMVSLEAIRVSPLPASLVDPTGLETRRFVSGLRAWGAAMSVLGGAQLLRLLLGEAQSASESEGLALITRWVEAPTAASQDHAAFRDEHTQAAERRLKAIWATNAAIALALDPDPERRRDAPRTALAGLGWARTQGEDRAHLVRARTSTARTLARWALDPERALPFD